MLHDGSYVIVLVILAQLFFLVVTANYAEKKGYGWLRWGFLFFFFGAIGWVILYLLPNLHEIEDSRRRLFWRRLGDRIVAAVWALTGATLVLLAELLEFNTDAAIIVAVVLFGFPALLLFVFVAGDPVRKARRHSPARASTGDDPDAGIFGPSEFDL